MVELMMVAHGEHQTMDLAHGERIQKKTLDCSWGAPDNGPRSWGAKKRETFDCSWEAPDNETRSWRADEKGPFYCLWGAPTNDTRSWGANGIETLGCSWGACSWEADDETGFCGIMELWRFKIGLFRQKSHVQFSQLLGLAVLLHFAWNLLRQDMHVGGS